MGEGKGMCGILVIAGMRAAGLISRPQAETMMGLDDDYPWKRERRPLLPAAPEVKGKRARRRMKGKHP